MKCLICKNGNTDHGFTNITFEKEGMILIIKYVPAEICTNCGEVYLDEEANQNIQKTAASAYKEGIQLEICSYKIA